MTMSQQMNAFFEMHHIKEQFKKGFEYLIKMNPTAALNINNKNVTINLTAIKYKSTDLNFHAFQAPILQSQKEVGYYALIYTDKAELIDELFVIY